MLTVVQNGIHSQKLPKQYQLSLNFVKLVKGLVRFPPNKIRLSKFKGLKKLQHPKKISNVRSDQENNKHLSLFF